MVMVESGLVVSEAFANLNDSMILYKSICTCMAEVSGSNFNLGLLPSKVQALLCCLALQNLFLQVHNYILSANYFLVQTTALNSQPSSAISVVQADTLKINGTGAMRDDCKMQ